MRLCFSCRRSALEDADWCDFFKNIDSLSFERDDVCCRRINVVTPRIAMTRKEDDKMTSITCAHEHQKFGFELTGDFHSNSELIRETTEYCCRHVFKRN